LQKLRDLRYAPLTVIVKKFSKEIVKILFTYLNIHYVLDLQYAFDVVVNLKFFTLAEITSKRMSREKLLKAKWIFFFRAILFTVSKKNVNLSSNYSRRTSKHIPLFKMKSKCR